MRKVSTFLVLALTAALSLGIAPGAATASDATPTPKAKIWVEKNPPAPSALARKRVQGADVTPMASGGGCANTRGAGVCISWQKSNNRLAGDFYVNSFSGISSTGTARVFIYNSVTGGYHYKYTAVTDHTGHYPVAYDGTSGSGVGWTTVDFYNNSGALIMSADSPYQYWP